MKFKGSVMTSEVIINLEKNVTADENFMLYGHTRLAAYCEPYVPMREGILNSSVKITPECITYSTPYAHYMYMGEVYSPNIPIRSKETGEIIGWFSPKGQPKHPTGRPLTYRHDLHPLAQAHWDVAAMSVHRGDLADDLTRYIEMRCR